MAHLEARVDRLQGKLDRLEGRMKQLEDKRTASKVEWIQFWYTCEAKQTTTRLFGWIAYLNAYINSSDLSKAFSLIRLRTAITGSTTNAAKDVRWALKPSRSSSSNPLERSFNFSDFCQGAEIASAIVKYEIRVEMENDLGDTLSIHLPSLFVSFSSYFFWCPALTANSSLAVIHCACKFLDCLAACLNFAFLSWLLPGKSLPSYTLCF